MNKMNEAIKFILVCQLPLIVYDFFVGGKHLNAMYIIIIFLTGIIYFIYQNKFSTVKK